VPIALRQQSAPSLSWLHERHAQGVVRTDKMGVRAPPLQMGQQLWGLLRRRPGPSRQRGYAMSDRHIHALNTCRVQSSRETQSLQCADESSLGAKAHHRRDTNQLPSLVAFLHLPVDQTSRHLPLTHSPPSTTPYEPVSEMGRKLHRNTC
jgi:hypothetical protein